MQAPGLFDIPDKRGKYGLVHNVGLGGAVVVSLLRRPEFYKEGGKDGRDRYVPLRHLRALGRRFFWRSKPCADGGLCYDSLGYNHAHVCKPITRSDFDKAKAKITSEQVLQFAKL